MRWQILLKTMHVWTGIFFGAFLCVTCFSGSVAVFRSEIESVFAPRFALSQTRVDVDAVVAKVRDADPGAHVTRVGLPRPDRNAYLLTLESEGERSRKILVDAGTGDVAGQLNLAWLDWTVDLHHNLLGGKIGRKLVGVVGVLLFLISATGLTLSLLRKISLSSLYRVRFGGGSRRFHYELHRATGLWAYALLTLLSFTGIGLAFPDAFRAVLGKPAPIAKPKPAAVETLQPLKEYFEIGRRAVPGAQWTELRLPQSPKDPVSLRFRMPSDLGTIGRNEVAMDFSGRILGVRTIADEPAGARFLAAFTPVHYAEVGGLTIKILWSLAGVAPAVLFITGLLFWFRKTPPRSMNSTARSQGELSAISR